VYGSKHQAVTGRVKYHLEASHTSWTSLSPFLASITSNLSGKSLFAKVKKVLSIKAGVDSYIEKHRDCMVYGRRVFPPLSLDEQFGTRGSSIASTKDDGRGGLGTSKATTCGGDRAVIMRTTCSIRGDRDGVDPDSTELTTGGNSHNLSETWTLDGFDPVISGGREEDFSSVFEAPSEIVPGDAYTVLVAQEAVEDRICDKEALISGEERKLDSFDPVTSGGREEDFAGV
jgi:hypothetical protein